MLIGLLSASVADAQDRARTWPGVDPSQLSTIHVVDDRGVETSGRLLRFERDAVVMMVDGTERTIESTRVRRIQRSGDSLKNGAIAGAVIGGILGGLSAGVADCPGSRSECPAFRIFAPILSAAFYAAVGTGIDALVKGRTTLYVAPDSPGATSSLRDRPGLRATLTVSWSW